MDSTGKKKDANVLDVWNNTTTCNLEEILLTNIKSSVYYKNLGAITKTYDKAVDEIYNEVEYLNAWMPNVKQTSSAFILLYKLFTFRLTKRQLLSLVQRKDSGYIRAIGLLYCRFTLPPKEQWEWISPLLEDKEEVVTIRTNKITIGKLAETLLSEMRILDTILPRYPTLLQREIEQKLNEWKRTSRGGRGSSSSAPAPAVSSSSSGRDSGRGEKRDYRDLDEPRERRRSRSRSRSPRRYSSSSGYDEQDRHRYRDRDDYERGSHGKRDHADREYDSRRPGRDREDDSYRKRRSRSRSWSRSQDRDRYNERDSRDRNDDRDRDRDSSKRSRLSPPPSSSPSSSTPVSQPQVPPDAAPAPAASQSEAAKQRLAKLQAMYGPSTGSSSSSSAAPSSSSYGDSGDEVVKLGSRRW